MAKIDVRTYKILERKVDSVGRVAIGKAFPDEINSDLAGETVEIAVLDLVEEDEGDN